jgi:hypothetical protein
MKIFLSWSGDVSRQVAKALHHWLPRMLHKVEPYMSEEDTGKGVRWSTDLAGQLDETQFGIICLTPDNLQAPWIHFEAGALSKSIDKSRVVPFLFGVGAADVTGPLVQFQGTKCEPDDMLRLIKGINTACGDHAIAEKVVEDTFSWGWPSLKEALEKISALPGQLEPGAGRSAEDLLREILDLTRAQQKLLSDPAELIPASFLEVLLRSTTSGMGLDLRADFEIALGGLLQAIAASRDAGEPGADDVAVCATRLQAVYERMINRRPRPTMRSRVIDEQLRLTARDE